MKKTSTGKKISRKLKPEMDWQTDEYERPAEYKLILPYQFFLLCRLADVTPKDYVASVSRTGFMLVLKASTGYHTNAHSIDRLLSYVGLVSYQSPDIFHKKQKKKSGFSIFYRKLI